MKRKWGSLTDAVLQALEQVGPMTVAELSNHLGVTLGNAGGVLTRLMRTSVWKPRRVYIQEYVYDQEGQRHFPRAVYAPGSKKDAQKPLVDKAAIAARYRNIDANRLKLNSVFHMGLSTRKARAVARKARA